jgi:DNA-binding MarR family transcriptional regulator/ribosomal protein S18 acetylase RimI-like enzyme
MHNQEENINKIRSFNRFYTNILGLLNQHILGSGYSLTEVRVLLEISKMHRCSANAIANYLNIDHSYMSRIIKKLQANELIIRSQSIKDNRVNFIVLTAKGSALITELNQKSTEQIGALIKSLEPCKLVRITEAMDLIKNTLAEGVNPIVIRNFVDSDIDYVISQHCRLYEEEYGLTSVFSEYVDTGVHEFAKHYDASCECLLIAEIENRPVGSIAIAKSDNSTAQLRYFLIEPEVRGKGLGHKLVSKVLEFCRETGYKHVFLETISALKTARHIYKSHGFTLTSSHENPSWGENVKEERWEMDL